jgi:hypothetical protein
MNNVDLSVLVCSVSDRHEGAMEMCCDLVAQAVPYHPMVEILILTDNRCRTIGMKRQALLDISQGDYVCFVDDDDDVHHEFVRRIMSALEPKPVQADVLTFPTQCVSEEYGRMSVYHSLVFPNEGSKLPSFKRKPWFMHPIRRRIAVSSRFTDKNWGEGSDWLTGLWPKLKKEESISDDPMYFYHWNDKK